MGPSRETLDDGRNAHLIQKDARFWLGKLAEHGLVPTRVMQNKGLHVWVKR
jgi:hypothetical protein